MRPGVARPVAMSQYPPGSSPRGGTCGRPERRGRPRRGRAVHRSSGGVGSRRHPAFEACYPPRFMSPAHDDTVRVSSRIQRKRDNLPRFVTVPASSIQTLGVHQTTVVICDFGTVRTRRTLKRLDEDQWFIDLPSKLCARLGVDTHDILHWTMSEAPVGLPEELEKALRSQESQGLWHRLSAARRRVLSEHVHEAAQPETRRRRAAQVAEDLTQARDSLASQVCPSCRKRGLPVGTSTLEALLKPGTAHPPGEYRFCATQACPAVWYSEAGTTFGVKDCRVQVAAKSTDPTRTLCYCFGYSAHDILADREAQDSPGIPATIADRCKRGEDRCEETNPRGRCCLGDIYRLLKSTSEPSCCG